MDRFQRQKSFQYKKYDLQSFLMMLVLLLLLCENVLSFTYIINYGFLTTETNLKALYIFVTTSSVKLFVVNVQIFVYNCVFRKKEKQHSKTFHILKMKAHFEKEPHFENKSSFRNPF